MASKRLRAGVVGTGFWADLEHLPGLQARADVEVAAICGRNADRLTAVADKFGVPDRFTDWQEMIARGRLDLVVITAPNVVHHPVTMAALDKGLHVIPRRNYERFLQIESAELLLVSPGRPARGRASQQVPRVCRGSRRATVPLAEAGGTSCR